MVALELAMCVFAFSCAFEKVSSASSSIRTERYKCSALCVLDSNYTVPVVYPVVSKMKCAAVCSKLPWCTMYSVVENGDTNDPMVLLPESCQLFMEASSACSVPAWSASNTRVCIKEAYDDDPVSTTCMMTPQRVLQVNNSKPDLRVNEQYLRNLLSFGYNFDIQFLSGTSKYFVKASHIRMDLDVSKTCCISILDYLSAGTLNVTVRSFCSNGSRDTSASGTSDPFYWDVEIPQSGKMTTNKKVFRTGGDPSALQSAMEAGADFKLLFTGDNKLVHADVILMQRNNKISTQSRIHENGQVNFLSHLINGSTEVLTLNQSTSQLSVPVLDNLQTVWLSNSCWQIVYSTSANVTSSYKIRNSVELGRKFRVRLSIDSLTILGAADYIQINSTSGTITAFVLRVLVQKWVLLDAVSDLLTNILGGATQNPTKWTHYLVTSDGKAAVFMGPVGSSDGKCSSVAANVEWFEEVRNWTLVHNSSSSSIETLALLASRVLDGSEVRVRVQVGVTRKWFSCDTIEVNDKGDNVRCQISSHVSAYMTGSNSIISWLVSTTTGSQPCTIKNECFSLAANEVSKSTVVTNSCLWPAKEPIGNPMSLDNVDWFVST